MVRVVLRACVVGMMRGRRVCGGLPGGRGPPPQTLNVLIRGGRSTACATGAHVPAVGRARVLRTLPRGRAVLSDSDASHTVNGSWWFSSSRKNLKVCLSSVSSVSTVVGRSTHL
eukprot:2234652-Prymnesium_polylepis.1